MALVKTTFGAWQNGGTASPSGGGGLLPLTPELVAQSEAAWGKGFTPPPGYVAPPLPMNYGPPPQPTTARVDPNHPTTAGSWTGSAAAGGQPLYGPEGAPATVGLVPGTNIPARDPSLPPPLQYGATPPAVAKPFFGIPPLALVAGGGLLLFLIVRRFQA